MGQHLVQVAIVGIKALPEGIARIELHTQSPFSDHSGFITELLKSYNVGFTHSLPFVVFFKREAGEMPSEFRKNFAQ